METVHLALYRQIQWHLADRARAAMGAGLSWRDFRVGCAAWAWASHWGSSDLTLPHYRIFTGANLKPVQEAHNICAEPVVLGAAHQDGAERILAIVVAGIPQPDNGHGIQFPTLHPCDRCRVLLRTDPIVRPDTLIFTVHSATDDIYEEWTVEELLHIHDACHS